MATRTEKFQTPNSTTSEKVAFESYVNAEITDLHQKLLTQGNQIKSISTAGSHMPFYNTTYFVNANLTISNPDSENSDYPVLKNPNSDEPNKNLYNPAGIRIVIICTKNNDSITLTIDGSTYNMVKGQYYEFIYSGENWYMVNSWYAKWR